MWRKLIVAAVIVCVAGISVANANVILTVNGDNLTYTFVLTNYPGELIVAVEGNTPVGPNDISIEAQNGTLDPNEPNGGYYFQFASEGEAAVNLITKVDMIIDGNSVPANTLIYQLWLFYVPDVNIYAAAGIGLAYLLPPVEEEAAQGELPADDLGEPLAVSVPEESNQPQLQPATDYNALTLNGIEQQQRKVLLHCPNNVDAITPAPVISRGAGTVMVFGEGGPSTGSATLTTSALGTGGGMMLDSVVEVNGDITTNQIWTAGNTYHITADVNVKALLVIKPGTIVAFATDKSMAVNNGGTLISSGTPDNPIIYTSDAQYPDYDDYYCPIYIEESASPATKVTYNYIEYAEIGIVVLNNRLDTDIENNYLNNNVYGIVEYGTKHTNITNNLVYGTYYYAIEVHMASTTGQGDADSIITMQNNTCDYYQDVGILVAGVANPDDAGWVVLTNNIVSGAYCGIYMLGADEYAYGSVANTGYYDNTYNKSWDFPEDSPVQQTNWPYMAGTGTLPVCYLRQDCNFINAGYEYIEGTRLIGKTTDVNGFPDSNKTDIGFHYPNWHFSNPGSGDSLSADLDHNSKVDFNDFAVFAGYWRQATYAEADLDGSGFVDRNDLAIFADQWLRLADPNIQIQVYGDSNNGYVDVGVSGYTPDTMQIFLFVDGQYVNEITMFEDGQTLRLDISVLGSGLHELKTAATNINNNVICSNRTQASFNCTFKYCTPNGDYVPNQPYYFSSFYQGSGNVNVKVYDEDNVLVWSQTYPAQNVNGFIPSTITSLNNLDTIVFEPTLGGMAMAKSLAMAFLPWLVPSNVRALLLLPDKEQNSYNQDVENDIKQAFQYRGVPYYKLKSGNASYKNLVWFASNRDIEYIYFMGHGGYRVAHEGYIHSVLRTKIVLSDGTVVSAKRSDFSPGGAPSWCAELPGPLEKTMHSMTGINFVHGLKFVQFDSCYSSHLYITSDDKLDVTPTDEYGIPYYWLDSDMGWAMGTTSIYDNFYQGWWGMVSCTPPYKNFVIDEWTELGDGASLYEALYEAIGHAETETLQNFVISGYGDQYSFHIE